MDDVAEAYSLPEQDRASLYMNPSYAAVYLSQKERIPELSPEVRMIYLPVSVAIKSWKGEEGIEEYVRDLAREVREYRETNGRLSRISSLLIDRLVEDPTQYVNAARKYFAPLVREASAVEV